MTPTMYKKQNHHSDSALNRKYNCTVVTLCRFYFCCLLKSVLLLEIQLSGLNPPYVCAWMSSAINHSMFLCSMIWGESMLLLCFGGIVDHHYWNKYSADIIRVVLLAYHFFLNNMLLWLLFFIAQLDC